MTRDLVQARIEFLENEPEQGSIHLISNHFKVWVRNGDVYELIHDDYDEKHRTENVELAIM